MGTVLLFILSFPIPDVKGFCRYLCFKAGPSLQTNEYIKLSGGLKRIDAIMQKGRDDDGQEVGQEKGDVGPTRRCARARKGFYHRKKEKTTGSD